MGSPSNRCWSAAPGTPRPAMPGNSGRGTLPIRLGSPGMGSRGTGTLGTPEGTGEGVAVLAATRSPSVMGACGVVGAGGNSAVPIGLSVDVPTTASGPAASGAARLSIRLASRPPRPILPITPGAMNPTAPPATLAAVRGPPSNPAARPAQPPAPAPASPAAVRPAKFRATLPAVLVTFSGTAAGANNSASLASPPANSFGLLLPLGSFHHCLARSAKRPVQPRVSGLMAVACEKPLLGSDCGDCTSSHSFDGTSSQSLAVRDARVPPAAVRDFRSSATGHLPQFAGMLVALPLHA